MEDPNIVSRKRYDRIAKVYDMVEICMEKTVMGKWRLPIWKEATGEILEVGVGTGRNIPFYPDNSSVTAIDFSPKMLERAKIKARKIGKNAAFHLMDVQDLNFPDQSFDTIVTSCVFCSVHDPVRGLQEMRRVCKTNGRIIMMEHVKSKKPILGMLMDLMNPVVVRLIGANINRDTARNIVNAGIHIVDEKNLSIDIVKLFHCSRN